MSFGENLRMIRKEKGLSQEDLAELLEVSRQAISKWEMDMGYPEVEKLLILANTLHVSLDDLMFSKKENIQEKKMITGSIVIKSPHQGTITTCNKVVRSNQMIGNKNSPKYALFAVDSNHVSFWGEATTFLGWYANEELVANEIEEIHNAIVNNIPTYTLQYSAKTKRFLTSIKIVEE